MHNHQNNYDALYALILNKIRLAKWQHYEYMGKIISD